MARDRRPARPKAFAQAIATPVEVNMRFTNVNIRYIGYVVRRGQVRPTDTIRVRVESTE